MRLYLDSLKIVIKNFFKKIWCTIFLMPAPAIHLPDLVEALVELIRRTSTDLPAPVEARLRAAMEAEIGRAHV